MVGPPSRLDHELRYRTGTALAAYVQLYAANHVVWHQIIKDKLHNVTVPKARNALFTRPSCCTFRELCHGCGNKGAPEDAVEGASLHVQFLIERSSLRLLSKIFGHVCALHQLGAFSGVKNTCRRHTVLTP